MRILFDIYKVALIFDQIGFTAIHGLVAEYIGDYKNALKDGNTSLAKDYKHEINSWKAEIVKEVKQQKIEKKMLAMMFLCKTPHTIRRLYILVKWIFYEYLVRN